MEKFARLVKEKLPTVNSFEEFDDIVQAFVDEELDDIVDTGSCLSAASGGHLDCLRYARENGCPWDAKGNHCLRYAHENCQDEELDDLASRGL